MSDLTQLTEEEFLIEFQRRFGEVNAALLSGPMNALEKELRNISLQLRESEKGKSDFLGNVRNEINNPLTSILGLSSAIKKLSADDKIRKMATLIYRQAFELDFQMRNIITTAEIELGEVKPMGCRVDVHSLIRNQISYLQPKSETSEVVVDLNIAEEPILFTTDPYLLQLIVINVLANAMEFGGHKGKVIVNVGVNEEEQLCLEVKDNGEGMDAHQLRVVFERFRQADSSSTKRHPGQGLGLSIVRALVDVLRGDVMLHSEPHLGTTVILKFNPLTSAFVSSATSSDGNEVFFNEGEEF